MALKQTLKPEILIISRIKACPWETREHGEDGMGKGKMMRIKDGWMK
jgi:hypothetical protein